MAQQENSGLLHVIAQELSSITVILTPKSLHSEDYFANISWSIFSSLIERLKDEANVNVLGFGIDIINNKQYNFIRFRDYSEAERFIAYVNSQGHPFIAQPYDEPQPIGLSKLDLIKRLKYPKVKH
ncbi:MAG: hypothetical protein AABX90_01320 [Nanoarchaeota archaeon]